MVSKVSGRQVKRNVAISILAQALSLAVSVVLNLFVPKYFSIEDFSYWQTFLLYNGYVGVLHFGLLDGLMLRYAKYDYSELNKDAISAQFIFLLIILTVFSVLGALAMFLFTGVPNKLIVLFVSISILTVNLVTYNSYLFQLTNRITNYSILLVLQRLIFGVLVTAAIILKWNQFYWLCIAYLAGEVIACLYAIPYNKGLYFNTHYSLKEAKVEIWESLKCGILLLLANWSSILIVNGGRMVIQWHWPLSEFGKVSFSFSITGLFLTFIQAIGIVLFPSLSRIEQQHLPGIYENLKYKMSYILLLLMLLYYPICALLQLWLPQYVESLVYLGYLLPTIIYSSKVSMLTNNFLKIYRREKAMLYINFFTVILAFTGFLLFAYVFENLILLLLWSVVAVMVRSILSERIVDKILDKKSYGINIIEIVASITFIITANTLSLTYGFIVYAVMLALLFLLSKHRLTFARIQ